MQEFCQKHDTNAICSSKVLMIRAHRHAVHACWCEWTSEEIVKQQVAHEERMSHACHAFKVGTPVWEGSKGLGVVDTFTKVDGKLLFGVSFQDGETCLFNSETMFRTLKRLPSDILSRDDVELHRRSRIAMLIVATNLHSANSRWGEGTQEFPNRSSLEGGGQLEDAASREQILDKLTEISLTLAKQPNNIQPLTTDSFVDQVRSVLSLIGAPHQPPNQPPNKPNSAGDPPLHGVLSPLQVGTIRNIVKGVLDEHFAVSRPPHHTGSSNSDPFTGGSLLNIRNNNARARSPAGSRKPSAISRELVEPKTRHAGSPTQLPVWSPAATRKLEVRSVQSLDIVGHEAESLAISRTRAVGSIVNL